MDFETPHRGAVLVYPDKKGKVLLRLPVLGGYFPLRLSPDNPRLMAGGQPVNQTDLGLLIERISHSVSDERVGDCSTAEDGRYVDIRVLARNHFSPTVTTRYRFRIDKATWLPIEVDESTVDGRLQRRVTFGNTRVNIGVTDQFMQGG